MCVPGGDPIHRGDDRFREQGIQKCLDDNATHSTDSVDKLSHFECKAVSVLGL